MLHEKSVFTKLKHREHCLQQRESPYTRVKVNPIVKPLSRDRLQPPSGAEGGGVKHPSNPPPRQHRQTVISIHSRFAFQ